MRSMKSLALGLSLALAAPLAADSYHIDTAHSEIGFQATHLGIAKVRGSFGAHEAKIDIHEKDVTKSSLEISIDAASVDTGNQKRDAHLKNADFFETDKFPKLTFKSTKIAKAKGGYKVTGDLTIRDVTKPVTLDATLSEPVATPWGVTKRGFSLSGTIKRLDFGLGSGFKGGTMVIADEVKLSIEGELDKAAAEKK